MAQVIIENPILNSPYEEPGRHFQFTEDGITDEVVESRRTSSYFVPIAQPRKKGSRQLKFDTEWTKDRIEENKPVNDIRQRVSAWRQGGYVGVTPTTSRLLQHWTSSEREKRLFFCQIEAIETAIYITEVAKKYGDAWIENTLREKNESANPGLPRMAFKMATGSGKTVVMAMLIAWHTLNKLANPQDARFSTSFLVVTPGLTIRDRLRVLLPSDPGNYYRAWDLAPPHEMQRLAQAKVIVTNFHAFMPREKVKVARLTKKLATGGKADAFTETPAQMVRRVCRELGNKKNIVVINDEAHHCYRRKPTYEEEKLTGDERVEAQTREEEARVWISGLEAVREKMGIRVIYDLSATPFFLRGSGYAEGTLFPWVVSDFSLIDSIEAGIVKIPRVPVADDSMKHDLPTYRDLWSHVRESLPRKGRKTEPVGGEPKLPVELEGALQSLYGNYERYHELWKKSAEADEERGPPPVFVIVCNNTNVSKIVFDYIGGWEKEIKEQTVVQAGALPIFRNDDGHGRWLDKPNTILVDSKQLESGEAMSPEFKKMAAREIEEFKTEYRARFPGRDAENLTDEDLLREVMNTIGKPGKLGQDIKCVVSVSMLTEGWDANTVTHILGIRAFGTQLLCEQVVGRGLRRMSYAPREDGLLQPEYAEVYGVPFSFIPCSGSTQRPDPRPQPTRVRADEARISKEITFPRLAGYRYEIQGETVEATFSDESCFVLSTEHVPTKTENAPIVGEIVIDTLDQLRSRRLQEVAFFLAKEILETYFRDEEEERQPKVWLFPQLLRISRRWLAECVTCKDNTFPQLLLFKENTCRAAERIYRSIVASASGPSRLIPVLRPYDTVGSTRYVDFDTIRPVWKTAPDKCHVTHVVADTRSWEQKMAQTLEDMDEVISYVKNQNLGFTIPYTVMGKERQYHPDFIVRIDDGHGRDDLLNLIVEVTGETRAEKAAKVGTARTLWVPAVNNHGGFGRWAFLENTDPWNAQNSIRAFVASGGRS